MIYDFVKAHHHFSDPEWDGEPIEPEPNENRPVTQPLPEPLSAREPANEYGKRQPIKVKLADGKSRSIQHMMATSFWHPDGTPMSAAQFMEALFGKLPEFFRDKMNCAPCGARQRRAGGCWRGWPRKDSAGIS